MTGGTPSVWTFLGASPLIWLLATLLAYRAALAIHAWTGASPLAHPVAVAVAILVAVLGITRTPYQAYFDGAQAIHFLLGPATVALAIPLYQQARAIRRDWFALLCAAATGSVASVVSAMGIAWLLGASDSTVLSMAAKSVTMPIAMGITEKIGGSLSLTSALVMLTGVLGATLAKAILDALRITDPGICGFALGVSAHGIGTARALQIHPEMGAFSGLAMGLSGVLTALLLPMFLGFLRAHGML